jgi:hypothetical protein
MEAPEGPSQFKLLSLAVRAGLDQVGGLIMRDGGHAGKVSLLVQIQCGHQEMLSRRVAARSMAKLTAQQDKQVRLPCTAPGSPALPAACHAPLVGLQHQAGSSICCVEAVAGGPMLAAATPSSWQTKLILIPQQKPPATTRESRQEHD